MIELWKLDGSWTFVQADTTDSTGYSFTGLGPGTYAVCEITQTDWYQSFPYAGATLPTGESVFDCTQLTPNSGGTFAAFGIQFTAMSGNDLTNNLFGNYLVPPGCTLTQGYWKTHSIYGPAAHPDDTWYLLPGGLGPDTLFFDSTDTWYGVFNTSPKGGNAWYILAHQYMAAVLNQLNGAGDVPGLADALSDAVVLLDKYDLQENIPKKTDQVLTSAYDRDEALAIADFLTQYNEGQLGIPHCGEAAFPGFTTQASSAPSASVGLHLPFAPILVLMLLPLTIIPVIGFLGFGRPKRKERSSPLPDRLTHEGPAPAGPSCVLVSRDGPRRQGILTAPHDSTPATDPLQGGGAHLQPARSPAGLDQPPAGRGSARGQLALGSLGPALLL